MLTNIFFSASWMRQSKILWIPFDLITTLWLFNIAMENCPFIDDFPIKISVCKGFSMAMLNNQRVIISYPSLPWKADHEVNPVTSNP